MKTAICTLLVAVSLVVACPKPGPDVKSIPSTIIDCTKDEIKQNGIALIPQVNAALQADDFKSALLGLINPAIGITADVLACVVRSVMHDYGLAAANNPNDEVSQRSAERARQFIEDQGYKYVDDPAPPPATISTSSALEGKY